MMQNRLKFCIAIALVSAFFLVLPASAGIYTIPAGGTVFMGEQRLDITATGVVPNAKIVWFGPAANGTSGQPSATVVVTDVKNFYVDPKVYGGKTGQWYTLPDKKPAFTVADPTLTIRVYDETRDVDVTNSDAGIPKGNFGGFRIETNLMAIMNRSGITGVPITIHVILPDGGTVSALAPAYPLKDIPISVSPYDSGPVWDTGQYPQAAYTVWAECNVNNMKNNYPVVGKTMTPTTVTVRVMNTTLPLTAPVTETTRASTTSVATTPVQQETSATPSPTASPGPGLILALAGLGGAALVAGRRGSR